MDTRALLFHVVRLVASAGAVAVVPGFGAKLAAGIVAYLAAFTFMHDVMHGALRLPRAWNERLLAFLGVLMLGSGAAMRRMHLLHHAKPLAAVDVEGAGANMSLLGAIASGPSTYFALRVAGYRRAPLTERPRQVRETVLAALVLLAALVFPLPALRAYVLATTLMQLLAPAWASHVPHHTPAWLAHAAAQAATLWRSPVLLSLAYHELHHAHPKVPCHRLAEAAG